MGFFLGEGGGCLVFCPDQQKQAKYRNVIMNTDINFIEHKGICNAITYDESSNKMKKKIIDFFFFFKEYSFSCSFPLHCRNTNISAPLTNLEEN